MKLLSRVHLSRYPGFSLKNETRIVRAKSIHFWRIITKHQRVRPVDKEKSEERTKKKTEKWMNEEWSSGAQRWSRETRVQRWPCDLRERSG